MPDYNFSKKTEVSLVLFDNDARGFKTVIVDIIFALDLKENLIYLLAHEFHHNYYLQLLPFDLFNLKDKDDNEMLIKIILLHIEGLADLIDKQILFDSKVLPESYISDYRREVDKGNLLVNEFNNGKSLTMSGHPFGYFLAVTILKNFGKETLIDTIGNPFMFIKLFNKTKSEIKFSDSVIMEINRLEDKYMIK